MRCVFVAVVVVQKMVRNTLPIRICERVNGVEMEDLFLLGR